MTPEELKSLIQTIILQAGSAGEINLDLQDGLDVRVERPRVREHGDWATNVAMQLGKKVGMNPRDFAQLIVDKLVADPGIDHAEIAGPGFINITVNAAAAGELARNIVELGQSYGHSDALDGHVINLEYVSANPTGPIHIGGARWAAVGDSLARILSACGARVVREYYFNDHGSQIDRFAKSLLARARGQEAPEDGYGGQYIEDIAQAVMAEHTNENNPLEQEDSLAQEFFREHGVTRMFGEIKRNWQTSVLSLMCSSMKIHSTSQVR